MATINDVARYAGVSKSTVSLVLNNSPKVKSSTRTLVENAIREMNFTPNLSAVELTTRRRLSLGLIPVNFADAHSRNAFDSVDNNYFNDVLSGIHSVLRHYNFGLLVEPFDATPGNGSRIPDIIRTNRTDGLFVVGGIFHDSFLETIRTRNIPVVIVGRTCEGFDSVDTDSGYAVYLGVQHLIEKGHREILYLSGPNETPSSGRKDNGYRRALAEANLPDSPNLFYKCDFTGQSAYNVIKTFHQREGHFPTAIFTSGVAMAAGVMRYLYEKRIRVPDEVSIVTYDDSILTAYASPAITSICINKEEIGVKAAQLMVERLNDPSRPPVNAYIPVRLIERQSVRAI